MPALDVTLAASRPACHSDGDADQAADSVAGPIGAPSTRFPNLTRDGRS